jgi:hypothetical protein
MAKTNQVNNQKQQQQKQKQQKQAAANKKQLQKQQQQQKNAKQQAAAKKKGKKGKEQPAREIAPPAPPTVKLTSKIYLRQGKCVQCQMLNTFGCEHIADLTKMNDQDINLIVQDIKEKDHEDRTERHDKGVAAQASGRQVKLAPHNFNAQMLHHFKNNPNDAASQTNPNKGKKKGQPDEAKPPEKKSTCAIL